MSRSRMSQQGPSPDIYWTMQSYQAAAAQLPHPSEEWQVSDVKDELEAQIRRFAARAIIHAVETDSNGSNTWTTDEQVWGYVEDIRDAGNWTPCGHKGVRNLGDGEYTCCNDDCDETFGRGVAEEVTY